MRQKPSGRNTALRFIVARLLTASIMSLCVAAVAAPPAKAPTPLLKTGQPVDWWFVFKFNAETFPGCGGCATGLPLWRQGSNLQTFQPAVRLRE